MKLAFILIIVLNLIVGAITYQRIKLYFIRWFIPFLVVTLIVEITGYFQLGKINGSNHWMYNIYTAIEFLFFSFVYYAVINNQKLKEVIKIFTAVFFISFIVNILWGQGWNHFHTITYRVGSLMIICWCFFYFRELMKSEILKTPLHSPMFWISTGLLFFYTGFFFYINAFDFIAYTKIREYISLFRFFSNFLNVLLYSFILVGIYFSWQTKT